MSYTDVFIPDSFKEAINGIIASTTDPDTLLEDTTATFRADIVVQLPDGTEHVIAVEVAPSTDELAKLPFMGTAAILARGMRDIDRQLSRLMADLAATGLRSGESGITAMDLAEERSAPIPPG